MIMPLRNVALRHWPLRNGRSHAPRSDLRVFEACTCTDAHATAHVRARGVCMPASLFTHVPAQARARACLRTRAHAGARARVLA
eukprot:2462600-Lingulodinium_polyedra.AAC.1